MGKWVFDKFLPGQGGDGVVWNDQKNESERLRFPRQGAPFEGFRWRSSKDLMVNYLSRLTGCRDRAEDIAQETFVRFYQQLDRYREQGTLSAYLLRIATNLVRSEERRKRRWRVLKPIFTAGDFPGGGSNGHRPQESPQARALAEEEHREVTRAIASLSR